MIYTIESLQQAYKNDETLKFLFFWGHTPNKDGSIGKSCLSQWWEAAFTVDGISYPTAEHWMMAEKARLFKDEEQLNNILKAKHPKQAKAFGRKVKNFNPEAWDAHKYEAVRLGNFYKFSQNLELKEYLLQTQQRILVEASPVDPVWGIGMAQDHPNAHNPNEWKGPNLLGFALMEVRDQLMH